MEYPSLDKPIAGAFRFNTDSSQLEIYHGNQWSGFQSGLTPELQTGGARGLFLGGSNEPDPSAVYDIIDYVNIATTGNAIDFGNLASTTQEGGGFGSPTRGFHFGGDPALNTIEYVTFSSTGDAVDFGDTTGDQSKHGDRWCR